MDNITLDKNKQILETKLNFCNRVAVEEYNEVIKALRDIQIIFDDAQKRIHQNRFHFNASPEIEEQIKNISKILHEMLSSRLNVVEQEIYRLKVTLSDFRIALFGRTMAGKSTLREAITGGDGSTIGLGAQDTTRDVIKYRWNKLCIVDTPGIASFQLDTQLRKKALDAAFKSDLVMFLVSSDSIQESVFEGMKEIFSRNKPVVFVLNVKRDLSKNVFMKKFLENPDKFFLDADIEGHKKRLNELTKDILPRIRVIPIHAQAAFLSTQPEYSHISEELYRASQLDKLYSELLKYVTKYGPILRTRTIIDGFVCPMSKVLDEIHSVTESMNKSIDYIHKRFDEMRKALENIKREARDEIPNLTCKITENLRSKIVTFVEENVENSYATNAWKNLMMNTARNEADAFIKNLESRIKQAVNSWQAEVNFDLSFIEEICPDLEGKKVINGKLIVQIVASVIVGILSLISSGLLGILGGIVSSIISRFFDSKEEKLRKKKAKMKEKLEGAVKKFKTEFEEKLNKALQNEIEPSIDKYLTTINHSIEKIKNKVGIANEVIEKVNRVLGSLNTRLILRALEFSNININKNFHVRSRIPGKTTRIVVKDGNPFTVDIKNLLSEILGERIEIVLRD